MKGERGPVCRQVRRPYTGYVTDAAFSDPLLFGHDATPGIVSVHAEQRGPALVWRRTPGGVTLERVPFRRWVLARDLKDAAHLLPQSAEDAPFHIRELPGEDGSLRSLISATDGQALRQELLRGAAKRGARASGFSELRGYWTMSSPIDQYLISSGRTFFKGLAFDDVHRLQFDLETTSLSPADGRIFMVSVRDNRDFEAVLEARYRSQEGALIEGLLDLIRQRDPDVLENHNIAGFDLPFLKARAETLGIPLDLGRPGGPMGLWAVQDGGRSPHWACAGREIVDTLDAARRLNLPSAGLKAVAQYYGLAPADRVYLEGAEIARTYRQDPERVRRYALQDVQEVDALARKVLAPSFALAQMAPRPYHRLPYAGPAMGVLEPMLVRAYLHAGRALPGKQPPDFAEHLGGTVRLYAEGVLPRVVKADVASMYPSLIRVQRIEPSSDPLHVFLHLMDALTARRLGHKAAAKRGEAGEHEALQGAMKLIVNAAYGYLGTGPTALFGDMAAADQVTAAGREVLDGVLKAFEAEGVTLIEADTDGVYFSVPEGWDEGQERQVVERVARTLPAGIALEFDGRWQAMLSHETKNYALLGYDHTLSLRGAAFESSRTEAYGRAFLRRALPALLSGDVSGVRQAYLDTLTALDTRTVRNSDVATRMRLTKSPEQYTASREKRKEAHYEALLKAGQNWAAGERVTLYHREQVGLTPLDEPAGADYDVSHYRAALLKTYVSRLRKAFTPDDFRALFAPEAQLGLFETPTSPAAVIWAHVRT